MQVCCVECIKLLQTRLIEFNKVYACRHHELHEWMTEWMNEWDDKTVFSSISFQLNTSLRQSAWNGLRVRWKTDLFKYVYVYTERQNHVCPVFCCFHRSRYQSDLRVRYIRGRSRREKTNLYYKKGDRGNRGFFNS